jgi:hypothetical protein
MEKRGIKRAVPILNQPVSQCCIGPLLCSVTGLTYNIIVGITSTLIVAMYEALITP